jgi:hypothetical protein
MKSTMDCTASSPDTDVAPLENEKVLREEV